MKKTLMIYVLLAVFGLAILVLSCKKFLGDSGTEYHSYVNTSPHESQESNF